MGNFSLATENFDINDPSGEHEGGGEPGRAEEPRAMEDAMGQTREANADLAGEGRAANTKAVQAGIEMQVVRSWRDRTNQVFKTKTKAMVEGLEAAGVHLDPTELENITVHWGGRGEGDETFNTEKPIPGLPKGGEPGRGPARCYGRPSEWVRGRRRPRPSWVRSKVQVPCRQY